jgi:hypothetical protein
MTLQLRSGAIAGRDAVPRCKARFNFRHKPGAEVVLASLRQLFTIGGDLTFQSLFSNDIKRPSKLSSYYGDVCTWPRKVERMEYGSG